MLDDQPLTVDNVLQIYTFEYKLNSKIRRNKDEILYLIQLNIYIFFINSSNISDLPQYCSLNPNPHRRQNRQNRWFHHYLYVSD